MKYLNRDEYNGDWKEDLRNGYGKFKFSNGKYEGEWENDEYNRIGKIILNNNDIYEGYFKNRRKNREIIIMFNNNDIITNFKNDLFEGKGKYKYSNGNIFEGI